MNTRVAQLGTGGNPIAANPRTSGEKDRALRGELPPGTGALFAGNSVNQSLVERSAGAAAGPGTNPNAKISEAITGRSSLPSYNFPLDLPRYHFGIIEAEWAVGSKVLSPIKQYRLPLPMPLVDNFAVSYDPNHQYFSSVNLVNALPVTASLFGATGIQLNTFKGVTLGQPEFRRIQFQWKLAPRSYAESEDLNQIFTGLRIGMTPPTIQGKWAFIFPRIYILYFFPNSKYLYKFKPVVLESLSVDYAGGNPVPAFYQAAPGSVQTSGATGPELPDSVLGSNLAENTPPESLMVTTTWLELEYWTQKDYKVDSNFQPTSNEFDVWNFYQLDGFGGGL